MPSQQDAGSRWRGRPCPRFLHGRPPSASRPDGLIPHFRMMPRRFHQGQSITTAKKSLQEKRQACLQIGEPSVSYASFFQRKQAFVAQSVEQLTLNQLVDGSNPPEGTSFKPCCFRQHGFFCAQVLHGYWPRRTTAQGNYKLMPNIRFSPNIIHLGFIISLYLVHYPQSEIDT